MTTLNVFVCEVCDRQDELTDDAAYQAGWDYPPFIGEYGVVGPRTCPNCLVGQTAWFALIQGAKPVDLTERQMAAVRRILEEPAAHE